MSGADAGTRCATCGNERFADSHIAGRVTNPHPFAPATVADGGGVLTWEETRCPACGDTAPVCGQCGTRLLVYAEIAALRAEVETLTLINTGNVAENARLRAEVERGCWMWSGPRHGEGYGKTGKNGLAHRVVYEALVGPIPDGMQLDHLCRNTGCVRPDHLEPVTRKENILRGESPHAKNARKTHCPKGHPLDGTERKGRNCKTCRREANRALRARGHKSPSDLTRNERRRRG